jgi:hypothetical protein
MIRRIRFGLAAIWLATPVMAQAQQSEVLARELYFEERGPNRRALWTADAMIARHPEIFRALRAEGIAAARLGDDCSESLPCHRTIRHEYSFSGSRLLAVLVTTDQFLGGAHGAFGVEDRIYDLRTGRRIRFGDLFTSWNRARPLLQAKICEALRVVRDNMEGIECPRAADLAYGLNEGGEIPIGGPASGFEVRMSDYALGSYAAGRENLFIMLDRPLYNLIKREYRADFQVAD